MKGVHMISRHVFSLLILSIVFLTWAPAGAIRGSVTQRQNGYAIIGATVQGMHLGPDSSIVQTTTDSSGHYILLNLAPGAWQIDCWYGQLRAEYPAYPVIGYADTIDGINFQLDLTPPVNNGISGTVTNALTHMVVVNAYLTLSSTTRSNGYNTYSDINGAYSFHTVLADTYQLSAIATGYAGYTDTAMIFITDTTLLDNFNVSLMPAPVSGALSGHVYDSISGKGIAGAAITVSPRLMPPDSLYPLNTVTDSDGYYSLSSIPADVYTVYCTAPGYQFRLIHDYAIDTTQTLDLRLVPIPTGTISGHVTLDGVPYPGVTIMFYSYYSSWSTVTNSQGYYAEILPVDQYMVVCSRPGGGPWQPYHPDSIDWPTPVTVTANTVTENIDFHLSSPKHVTITITGTVVDQDTAPLAGATVQIWGDTLLPFDSSAMPRTAVTDQQGHYQITTSLTIYEPFQCTVSATKDHYSMQLYDHVPVWYLAHIFSISTDSTISGIDFLLDSLIARDTNSISGRVTNSSGVPIAGAVVYATGTDGSNPQMAISDTGGNYRLTHLLNQLFIISFNARGFVGEIYNNVISWENATPVEALGTVTGIDAVLDSTSVDSLGGTITGQIRDGQGNPVAGVLVTISNGANKNVNSYTSSSNGSYLLEWIHGGDYMLTGTKPGYATSSGTVNVPAQLSGRVTFDLNLSTQSTLAPVSVSEGWNIVSVSGQPGTPIKTALFPTAMSNAYAFDEVYQAKDSLQFGVGYWLRFGHSAVVTLQGFPTSTGTFPVRTGWNLIGSISTPVSVSSITSNPGGLITSNFFEYDGGYYLTQTINPGKGYWVKVSNGGDLVLGSSSSAGSKIIIRPSSELPPSPPEVISGSPLLPKVYALEQCFPNPFNPTTLIKYHLPADSKVTLKVYNLLGQGVQTLTDGIEQAGYKRIEWNASGFASGVYYYRLEAVSTNDPGKSFTSVRKMMLIK